MQLRTPDSRVALGDQGELLMKTGIVGLFVTLAVLVAGIAPGIGVSVASAVPVVDRSSSNATVSDISSPEFREDLLESGYRPDTRLSELQAEFDSAWDQTISSYCSTPKWLSPLAKRHNRIFNSACKTHDRCYSAASRTDRRTCDARFKRDMRALCVKKYNNKTQHRLRESCLDASTSYYTGVRIFGGSRYKGKGKNN